jgi:predicted Rossmann fold flavoprotein
VIHDLSRKLEQATGYSLSIDFLSAQSSEELEERLQLFFHTAGTKQIKNGLLNFLPERLVPIILMRSRIDLNKKMNEVLRTERQELVRQMKLFKFQITQTQGFEKANVTIGGISLAEIEPKTMRSKLVPNLYFAGEVLDLDGPTGGYNLQIAWTTGRTAGEAVAQNHAI